MQTSARWASEFQCWLLLSVCPYPGSRQLHGRGGVAGLRHPRLYLESPLLWCLTWTMSIPTPLLASTASHFWLLSLSKWGQKSVLLSLASIVLLEWCCSSPPHLCSVLVSFVSFISVLFLLLYHISSIHLSFALQWFCCLCFMSFSLSFHCHFLPDKENSCTFISFHNWLW